MDQNQLGKRHWKGRQGDSMGRGLVYRAGHQMARESVLVWRVGASIGIGPNEGDLVRSCLVALWCTERMSEDHSIAA